LSNFSSIVDKSLTGFTDIDVSFSQMSSVEISWRRDENSFCKILNSSSFSITLLAIFLYESFPDFTYLSIVLVDTHNKDAA
jgi:hypothetical protein